MPNWTCYLDWEWQRTPHESYLQNLWLVNKESLSKEQCVKRFQIHQYFWGITKLKAPTQVWRFNVPNGCGAGMSGCHFIRYMYTKINSD